MAKHWCVNGTLNDSDYSSPMPVIGLYIAAATLVCSLLMSYDLCIGLCSKQRWLPCKFFTLSSLTLTFLSVVTKLPVDLTTPMPKAEDQLSKLTGTTMLCVCMAFFMPSLGSMNCSESFSNMASLTILVVTVAVNICIQIKTGVIFSFIVEHIVILSLLLILLVMMWISAFEIKYKKDVLWDSEAIRQVFEYCEGSMLERLRWLYVSSYMANPQFIVSRLHYSVTASLVSILCVAILTQAVLRSLILNKVGFCNGDSDYEWSMWVVVGCQFFSVVVGFIGNFVRYITLVRHIAITITISGFLETKLKYERHKNYSWLQFVFKNLTYSMLLPFSWVSKMLSLLPLKIAERVLWLACSYRFQGDVGANVGPALSMNYLYNLHIFVRKDTWSVGRAEEFMGKWTERAQRNSPIHLLELLSNTPPSNVLVNAIGTVMDKPSCPSVAALVKWAARILSSEHSQSLARSLDEAFEIIYFVDKKLIASSYFRIEDLSFAKRLWKSKKVTFVNSKLRREFDDIEAIIGRMRSSSEAENDFARVRQLFAKRLHWFLGQLPLAIFKDVVDCPWEDFEERTKNAIKLIYKVQPLANMIRWEFPGQTNLTRLVNPSANNEHGRQPGEGSEARDNIGGSMEIEEIARTLSCSE